MTQDDRMETITDPAEIRATSDERGCCDCRTFDQHERECILPDERTTPAPVGAAVALDLDAIEERAKGVWKHSWEVIGHRDASRAIGDLLSDDVPALVAEVRRLTEENAIIDRACVRRLDQSIAWMERADSAEAEMVTLRARLAAVESLVNNGQTVGWIERDGDVAWIAADAIRAALATTGEGEHVAREVFTADGIAFVRWLTEHVQGMSAHWLIRYDPDDGEPYGEVCDCEIGDDHDATGEGE